MHDRALHLARITEGFTLDQYLESAPLQAQVERGLEIIGESVNHLSEEFREGHPEIPWAKMVGQRNVIAHGYVELEQWKLWETVVDDLPVLIRTLQSWLGMEPG